MPEDWALRQPLHGALDANMFVAIELLERVLAQTAHLAGPGCGSQP